MNDLKTNITDQLRHLQMLMHRAYHDITDTSRNAHNPYRGQGRVLSVLKLKPETSQKELSYLLDMSKQALAELLTKLEKNGYILRQSSEDDKRVTVIRLTEEGMKCAVDMDEAAVDSFHDQVLDCLEDEELEKFDEYLGRVIKRYEDHFPDEDFERRRRLMSDFLSNKSDDADTKQ